MDNTAKLTSDQKPTEDQAVPIAQQAPKIVPNRGGIPVVKPPVQMMSSSKGREHEPISSPMPDIVKMTDKEIVEEEKTVEQEIKSIIKETPDNEKPIIPPDVQDAGVEFSAEDTAIYLKGPQALPMSADEAEFTRKKYKWKDSIAWFSDLIVYHWKKLKANSKKK